MEKAGGKREYQYGEFLRAVGGRPRVQGSKAAGPTFDSEDAKGSAAEKRAVPAVQGGPVEAREAHGYSYENPSATGKENTVIQGSRADLAHVDSPLNITHADVTKTASILKGTGPKIQQDNQLPCGFTEAEETCVTKAQKGGLNVKPTATEAQFAETGIKLSNLDQNGPLQPKAKRTWNRMNRMDFGLSGLTKSITLPGLGKRDTREREELQNEEQIAKRGRLSDEEQTKDDVSAGVESHPCREQ